MVTLQAALHTFAHDVKVQGLIVLIVVDLVLGVIAAVKTHTFKLSWITNFLRDDVAFKIVPYFVLYFVALVFDGEVIDGVSYTTIADAAYALAIAAMIGSLLGSLKDLGVTAIPIPPSIT